MKQLKAVLYSIGFALGLILTLALASKSEVFAMIYVFAVVSVAAYLFFKEIL